MDGNRREVNRRDFVKTAAVLAAGASGVAGGARAVAQPAEVKIGLYSITYGGGLV